MTSRDQRCPTTSSPSPTTNSTSSTTLTQTSPSQPQFRFSRRVFLFFACRKESSVYDRLWLLTAVQQQQTMPFECYQDFITRPKHCRRPVTLSSYKTASKYSVDDRVTRSHNHGRLLYAFMGATGEPLTRQWREGRQGDRGGEGPA